MHMTIKDGATAMYEGRPEGAIRKCHRLSAQADYLESCERYSEASKCHQEALQGLQDHLKTQISVSTRRQVELLIRRHQNRIFYIKKREEERCQPSHRSNQTGSCFESSDEYSKIYLSQNPTMLQEIKKCQVQFNNLLELLHSLARPDGCTQALAASNLLTSPGCDIGNTTVNVTSPATAKESSRRDHDTSPSTACCLRRDTPAEFQAAKTAGEATTSSTSREPCSQCLKDLPTRLQEEESLVKIASELPAVWWAKDKLLHVLLADYGRLARTKDALKEQVKRLTRQMEHQEQSHHSRNMQQQDSQTQLLTSSTLTFRTNESELDENSDMSTSGTPLTTVDSESQHLLGGTDL